MIKSVGISAKQVSILASAQQAKDTASRELDLIACTIMAGLDVTGQLVSIDTEKNLLNIEVPDA